MPEELDAALADLAKRLQGLVGIAGDLADSAQGLAAIAEHLANLCPHGYEISGRFGDSCPECNPVQVNIPGTFTATYHDGRITNLVFIPHEASAGYFGPKSSVIDGGDLDVADQDGPFWRAMGEALAVTSWFAVDNPDDDNAVNGPALPIQWEA